ncbi:MAG TPA: hypothetical protein VGG63_00330 [Steroidobacteraceae bacterium]
MTEISAPLRLHAYDFASGQLLSAMPSEMASCRPRPRGISSSLPKLERRCREIGGMLELAHRLALGA